MSFATATLVVVALCAVYLSPLAVSAAPSSSANVQAPNLVGGLGTPLLAGTGPAVTAWSGGYDLFYVGTNQALYQARWTSASDTWMHVSLGGICTSSPAALSSSGDKVQVFVRGTDGAVYSQYYPYGGLWSGWSKLAA